VVEAKDLYPEESLVDKGQMSADEAKAWQAYNYISEERFADNHKKDERFLEFQSIYESSNFDFQNCRTIGELWWPNYFAVETNDIIGLVNHLTRDYIIDLINVVDTNAPLFQNPRQNLVISPPCNGVIFIYWTDVQYSFTSPHHQNLLAMLRHDWASISDKFGDVFYISDAKNNPGFLYWRQGKLVRAIAGQDDRITKYGNEIHGEDLIGFSGTEFLLSMREMAINWNVWPLNMRPFRPDETAYAWLVDG